MPHVLVSISPHSDDPGLAVARALRRGLSDVHLTAVSRHPHGPAIHMQVFDDVWSCPSWPALDPDAHAANIKSRLDAGAVYLPTDPKEVFWLAKEFPESPSVLTPSSELLARIAAPESAVADGLPVSIPDRKPISAPVEDLHAFGRRHDWTLWMRAPTGERRAFEHWSEFDSLCEEMVEETGSRRLWLQQRIDGRALSVPFAAHSGTLVEAVLVRPSSTSAATYQVESAPVDLQRTLADMLADEDWTGGGSLRLVEDADGTLWLDAWRPCFSVEVNGVAQCRVNLPARLLSATTDAKLSASPSSQPQFCRVSQAVALPDSTARTYSDANSSAQHASPTASWRDQSPRPWSETQLTDDLRTIVADLPSDWASADTPRAVLLPSQTRRRFRSFADAADQVKTAFDLDSVRVGLSIKTNPTGVLLDTARATGMLAETIHPDEMAHARRHGFDTDEIIVNGPVQALLPELDDTPFALFGDAVGDLTDLPFDASGAVLGLRTRPPERGRSRFGVDLSNSDTMDRFCEQVHSFPAETQVGLHFHGPSSTLGHNRWWSCVERVLEWAQMIHRRTGRPVRALDLGGGWHPDDWLDVFIPELLDRRETLQSALPDLNVLLLEPGKALSQPLGVVLSRVLDVRESRSDVILDASIAELPNIDYHPHRLLARTSEHGWHRLPRGEGSLLGRLCMEADILGRTRHVSHLSPGDTVVICDAGAYDASMAYPFGRGQTFTSERSGEDHRL